MAVHRGNNSAAWRSLRAALLLACARTGRGHTPEASQCASGDATRTLRLVIVRHAESYNNVLNLVSTQYYRANRLADPPITILGEEQAEAAAKFISESRSGLMQQISEVHVSPTIRTLQTAAPIVKALPGVRAFVDVDTFEVGGVYNSLNLSTGENKGEPGLTRAQMGEFGYEMPDAVRPDGWYSVERGKESKAEGAIRASKVAARLKQIATALTVERKTMMLVSHGDFIGLLIADLLGHGSTDASASLSFKVSALCLAQ